MTNPTAPSRVAPITTATTSNASFTVAEQEQWDEQVRQTHEHTEATNRAADDVAQRTRELEHAQAEICREEAGVRVAISRIEKERETAASGSLVAGAFSTAAGVGVVAASNIANTAVLYGPQVAAAVTSAGGVIVAAGIGLLSYGAYVYFISESDTDTSDGGSTTE